MTFEQLIELVHSGNSVRCEKHHHRIDINKITNESTYDNTHITKEWQLEKQDEMYCFKTFDCYGRAEKQFFTISDDSIHEQILIRAFIAIRYYIEISREDILGTFGVESDWFPEKIDLPKSTYLAKPVLIHEWGLKDTDVKETTTIKLKHFKSKKMVDGKCQKTGEGNIRIELNKYIQKIYPNEPTKDEYTTFSLSARADTVVFSKQMIHVFEIKSEKDSFTRLENQINDYKQYADKITIVLHVKKLKAFMKNHTHLLNGVGLMIYYSKDTPLELKIKPKKLNPTTKKLSLLWSQELADILCIFSGCSKCNCSHKRGIISNKVFTKLQAHKITNIVLNDRFSKQCNDKKLVNYGTISMNDFIKENNIHKINLQKKFDRAIKALEKEQS